MKRSATIACLVLIASIAVVSAQEAGYKVIAHATSTPDLISKQELSRLFLKQRKSWANGQKASPVDQKANAEVRALFSEAVLGKTVREADAYWQGLVFSGKASPPPTAGSDQEVIAFVRSNPGAVGYVAAGADTGGVKVLRVTD